MQVYASAGQPVQALKQGCRTHSVRPPCDQRCTVQHSHALRGEGGGGEGSDH